MIDAASHEVSVDGFGVPVVEQPERASIVGREQRRVGSDVGVTRDVTRDVTRGVTRVHVCSTHQVIPSPSAIVSSRAPYF
jgi:hypothetical protein